MNTSERKKLRWYQRTYLIDPPVQMGVILRLTFVALVFSGCLCFLAYDWMLNLKPIFDPARFGPITPAEAFQMIADKLLFRLIGVVVVMFISLVSVGVYTTFRFAGPIWKLQKDLNRFFAGENINKIQFRKSDDYKTLPDLVNKLIEGYKGQRGQ